MNQVSDRNLLFGILAVQLDYITQAELIEAANAWMVAKEAALGQILVDRGSLTDENREFLDLIVDKHVSRTGSPEKSLTRLQHNEIAVRSEQLIQSLMAQTLPATAISDAATNVALDATTLHLEPNNLVGDRYFTLYELARGGLGQVSVARDNELDREVALKEILDHKGWSSDARERFVAEAKITGGLEHPGIVPVYGLGRTKAGRPFYAMRLIRGRSLKDEIESLHTSPGSRQKLAIDPARLRRLLRSLADACNAVAYAHSRGVIHRDLKPSNIMLGKFGETLVVDWGLAKVIGGSEESLLQSEPLMGDRRSGDSSATMMGTIIGTPGFMSPEQADGRLDLMDKRSDIFGLGACLYSILTNRIPFQAASKEESLAAVRTYSLQNPRQLDSRIDKPLEAICLKAMARRREDRYPTAVALAEDIDRWIAGEAVTAMPEPLLQRGLRWARRHQTFVVSSLLLLAASLLGLMIANQAISYQRDLARQERDEAKRQRVKADAATARAERERAVSDTLRVAAEAATQKALHNSAVSVEILEEFIKGLADDRWANIPQMESERVRMVNLAVDRYTQLLKEAPDDLVLRKQVLQLLIRSATLYRITGEHSRADQQIGQAMKILDELKDKGINDVENAGVLADILYENANSTKSQRGARQALPISLRQLEIRRKRFERDPLDVGNQLGMAKTLLQHSEILLETQDALTAEKHTIENLGILQNLTQRLENQFVVHLFHFHGHTVLGQVYVELKRWEEAEAEFNKAIVMADQALVRFDNESNTRNFRQIAVRQLAELDFKQGRMESGLKRLEESRQAYQDLHQEFPQINAYRNAIIRCECQTALQLITQGEFDAAVPHAQAARKEFPTEKQQTWEFLILQLGLQAVEAALASKEKQPDQPLNELIEPLNATYKTLAEWNPTDRELLRIQSFLEQQLPSWQIQ